MSRWNLSLTAALCVCMFLGVAPGAAQVAKAAPPGGAQKAAHKTRPAMQAARKVDFVIDGKPAAAIVLPDGKAPIAKAGADELVDFIEHCTGAKLAIVHEKAGLPDGVKQGVYIGDTKAARAAGVNVDQLEPDEYRILTQPNKLILAGKDKLPDGVDLLHSTQTHNKPAVWHGSYYAAISLIRHDLGGAFLWPGDLGTVYPRTKTLSATVSDRDFAPPFVLRRLWNSALNHHRYVKPAHQLGYTNEQIKHKQQVTMRYFLRQGGGANQRIEMGHSFTHWWAKYGKTHPDYFALQPTGLRGPAPSGPLANPHAVKLDVSNPAIIKPIMEKADKLFSKRPDALTLPVAINDGPHRGFCMGERCRSWDVKSAQPYNFEFAKKDGTPVHMQYVFLTDRYAKFWTRLNKTFSKKYPDKMLFVFAYGPLREAPVKTPLPDDLLVSFVPGQSFYAYDKSHQKTMRRWDDWAAKHPKMLFRPNALHFAKALPMVYVHKLSQDLKHARKTGMIGGVYDIIHNSWGTQGLDFYVLCRLTFDPQLPVDQLIDEFCTRGFGDAAGPMKRYFAFLEKTTSAVAAKPPVGKGHEKETNWMRTFTRRLAQARPRIEALFNQARRAVPEDSPQAKRIDFMWQGYRYALLMHNAFAARSKPQRQAAIKAFKQFLKANRHTFVVDRPFIKQAMHKGGTGGYHDVEAFLSQPEQ